MPDTTTAPPTAMKIRSAAVRKIFSVGENLGGSGGGSFRPLSRSSPEVSPREGRGSVALIGLGARVRRIVLAVLVLVRRGLEPRDVEGERERGLGAGAHGHR